MQSENTTPTINLTHEQASIVRELVGVIPSELTEDFNYKQEYTDYLEEKYPH